MPESITPRKTRRTAAERSKATKVVGPGQADSKRKARQSAAKVQANAEKVAAINEQQATDTDRVQRIKLAKQEQAAVKAWMAKSEAERGERPATPNLDAINRGEKAQGGKAKREGTTRSRRGERGLVATAEAKRLGKRGAGKKVTDEELLAYVAKVRKDHPESSQSDELEYAYWVERLAVTRARWSAAWEGKLDTKAA